MVMAAETNYNYYDQYGSPMVEVRAGMHQLHYLNNSFLETTFGSTELYYLYLSFYYQLLSFISRS